MYGKLFYTLWKKVLFTIKLWVSYQQRAPRYFPTYQIHRCHHLAWFKTSSFYSNWIIGTGWPFVAYSALNSKIYQYSRQKHFPAFWGGGDVSCGAYAGRHLCCWLWDHALHLSHSRVLTASSSKSYSPHQLLFGWSYKVVVVLHLCWWSTWCISKPS